MGHLTTGELQRRIDEAKKKVEVEGKYYHYKNPDKHYLVEDLCFWEATEEVCVIYRQLYDDNHIWVRTVDNFTEEIPGKGKRFVKI